MEKPTHRPGSSLTRLATRVPGPRRATSSSLMRCSRGLLSKRVKRSSGSCGAMRTFSCSASVLMREMRAMASEWMSAARERLTSEATCRALWMARGSCSSVRKS